MGASAPTTSGPRRGPGGPPCCSPWTLRLPVHRASSPSRTRADCSRGRPAGTAGGPQLYGRLFVDRPPGCSCCSSCCADALGGMMAARCWAWCWSLGWSRPRAGSAGCSAGRTRRHLGGAGAAALACEPGPRGPGDQRGADRGPPGDGELRAGAGRRTPGRPGAAGLLLVAAGLLAGLAPTGQAEPGRRTRLRDRRWWPRQAWHARWPGRRTAAALAGFAVGAAVPAAATALWADGPGTRVSACCGDHLVQFRVIAAEVIAGSHVGRDAAAAGAAADDRCDQRPARWPWSEHPCGRSARRRRAGHAGGDRDAAVEVAGALLGGSYWTHYLIALVPGAVVLTALAARREVALRAAAVGGGGSGRLVRGGVRGDRAHSPGHPGPPRTRTPSRLAEAGTGAQETPERSPSATPTSWKQSGLRPGYRQLWSLPVRSPGPAAGGLHPAGTPT